MKKLLLLLLLFPLISQAQSQSEIYIELIAKVDWYGDARIYEARYPNRKINQADTLINKRKIDGLIKNSNERKEFPVQLINELNVEGWILVTTSFVPGHEEGFMANKGKMIFYLKKML